MTDRDPSDYAFHFETGRPCLDFTATLADRGPRQFDRWRTPADLGRWFVEAGFSEKPFLVAGDELAVAKGLREAIYAVISARRDDGAPDRQAVATVNGFATRPQPVLALTPDGTGAEWRGAEGIEAALGRIAADAVDLVTGPDLARLRECAAPDCSVLFVDLSRPGRRRWCSMARCGNRHKKAAFRSRKRARN